MIVPCSDLTGKPIKDLLSISIGKEVYLFNGIDELVEWIKLPEPRPKKGGYKEVDDYTKEIITDEAMLIRVEYKGESFVFNSIDNLKKWMVIRRWDVKKI